MYEEIVAKSRADLRNRTKWGPMSGKTESSSSSSVPDRDAKADRRIRRTRDTLGDALVELMQEKPFDNITVQEVLDRADVSRTTFYTHYRDKDDLFLSDVEDFLEGMSTLLTRKGASQKRVAPVRELFTHLADVRDFHHALTVSGKNHDVRELGLGYFARSIEQRLTAAGVTVTSNELRAWSHALAGAMFWLLEWWIAHEKVATPEEMDVLFHRMVWSGIGLTSREPHD